MAAGASKFHFPIIGIGASAGGLRALERFLGAVPEDTDHAFVIVQHLDPTHKTQLAELLQRCTKLPVAQITHGMIVERGHVYVIPPDHDVSIMSGVLHLLERAAPRGLRLPIDAFLRALADDQRACAMGVILSGMGSDGTLGLRAIHERGGATFVQEPESAEFDSMPRSAISAGVADVVAPAEELHARIVSFLAHGLPVAPDTESGSSESDAEAEGSSADDIGRVILYVRTNTGHDFSQYKRSTLTRRISLRMGFHHIAKVDDYLRLLHEKPEESELLFRELLIGVTRFFRDPDSWEELIDTALPALFAARPEGGPLRAWVVGCSTGEEAFSLAIAFTEAAESANPKRPFSLQIFATDLDAVAIAKARTAVYPSNIVADVSEARLNRFFAPDERGYRLRKEIREMVIFAPQNVVMDPPFTRLDIVLCRNLLIYFTPVLQRRILPLFHYCLRPDGILMLGNAETTGASSDLFVPISERLRIYRNGEHRGPRAGPIIPMASPHLLSLHQPARPTQEKAMVPTPPADETPDAPDDVAELRRQLAAARSEILSSQEELRASNEDLQSANEELITSKEEMQSMNEELQTVNHELQAKLDELTLASNDMVNLLNSTSIATLFLDTALLVRRFTTPTTEIIRLIPTDVGRPITDIVSALDFPDLPAAAREVLRTLVVFEREIAADGGRWFVVRIMPYRTFDGRIEGVVLTFTDVTKAKVLEGALREAQSKLEGRLATKTAELDANDKSTRGE